MLIWIKKLSYYFFYTSIKRSPHLQEKITKVALSYNDAKRYLAEDENHSTLPYGHYAIPRKEV